ncbi:MAG: TolC family protein [Planctomycetota bacterium]
MPPPPLPATPAPGDYLEHAFLANAELQARYWEWRAAIEQIPQDASFPNVAIPFSVMFDSERMSLWDRTTLGITNDPMTNIPFPGKLSTAGRRALEAARAAGLRFEGQRFGLQRDVLSTYYDLALIAEMLRIRQEQAALQQQTAGELAVFVRTGKASPSALLQAQAEVELVLNEIESLRSQAEQASSRMNALLNRPADALVPLPLALPAPRALPVSDAELLAYGAERSPELAALEREIAGRNEALALAEKAYIPDFGVSLSITGSIAQTIGAMLVLPTRLEAIRAGIEQAKANLRAAEAVRTQYERDLARSFIVNLRVLRNDDRQVALFENSILPRAEQVVQAAHTSLTANRGSFGELLEAERMLLEARLALAQLRVEREKALAAIESWSAVDVAAMRPAPMRARRMDQ